MRSTTRTPRTASSLASLRLSLQADPEEAGARRGVRGAAHLVKDQHAVAQKRHDASVASLKADIARHASDRRVDFGRDRHGPTEPAHAKIASPVRASSRSRRRRARPRPSGPRAGARGRVAGSGGPRRRRSRPRAGRGPGTRGSADRGGRRAGAQHGSRGPARGRSWRRSCEICASARERSLRRGRGLGERPRRCASTPPSLKACARRRRRPTRCARPIQPRSCSGKARRQAQGGPGRGGGSSEPCGDRARQLGRARTRRRPRRICEAGSSGREYTRGLDSRNDARWTISRALRRTRRERKEHAAESKP